jgi:hypothetical protein
MQSWSPMILISSELGLGFLRKALSKENRMLFSIEVRFFRRLPKKCEMRQFK